MELRSATRARSISSIINDDLFSEELRREITTITRPTRVLLKDLNVSGFSPKGEGDGLAFEVLLTQLFLAVRFLLFSAVNCLDTEFIIVIQVLYCVKHSSVDELSYL